MNILVLCCEDDRVTYFNYHSPSDEVGPIIANIQNGLDESISNSNGKYSHAQLHLFDVKNQHTHINELDLDQFEGLCIPGR